MTGELPIFVMVGSIIDELYYRSIGLSQMSLGILGGEHILVVPIRTS